MSGTATRQQRPVSGSAVPLHPRPAPRVKLDQIYNVTGTWTDTYGYTWELNQDASGNIAGNMSFNDGSCPEPTWPVTGSLSVNQFNLTATNPSGGDESCVSSFEYMLTLSGDGKSASGTWTNSDGDNGTVSMTLNGPAILITLTPAPDGDEYAITDAPVMPVIQATASVTGISPDPTPTTTFTWAAKLTIFENGGSGKLIDYSSYLVQNTTTTGSSPYTLTFTDPTLFLGGNLLLTVTATVNGQALQGTTPADLVIDGTNPQRSSIQSAIATQVPAHSYYGLQNTNVTDVMERIACRESGQIQFNADPNGGEGPPYVAGDNGIGIMQITQSNPDLFVTKPAVVFNWQTNTTSGVTTYQTKAKIAVGYPGSVRNDDDGSDPDSYQYYITNTINPARVAAKLSPITILPAPAYAAVGNIGSNPPNQLLEDGVRGYNGFAGTPVFNANVLHEFVPNATFLMTVPDAQLPTLGSNPTVWARVCSEPGAGVLYGPGNSDDCESARGSSGDPVYVNNVAANPAACPNGSQSN